MCCLCFYRGGDWDCPCRLKHVENLSMELIWHYFWRNNLVKNTARKQWTLHRHKDPTHPMLIFITHQGWQPSYINNAVIEILFFSRFFLIREQISVWSQLPPVTIVMHLQPALSGSDVVFRVQCVQKVTYYCGSCLQFGLGCWLVVNQWAALTDWQYWQQSWRLRGRWAEAQSCGLLCVVWVANKVCYLTEPRWCLVILGAFGGNPRVTARELLQLHTKSNNIMQQSNWSVN